MWISKKKWADLFDENFKLKKENKKLEYIENAVIQAEAGAIGRIYYIGNDCILTNYLHYCCSNAQCKSDVLNDCEW